MIIPPPQIYPSIFFLHYGNSFQRGHFFDDMYKCNEGTDNMSAPVLIRYQFDVFKISCLINSTSVSFLSRFSAALTLPEEYILMTLSRNLSNVLSI